MPSQIQEQLSPQTSPVQPQSQNSLQPTSSASQAPSSTTASGALPQEQLTAPGLRVGNSSTVITNSTRPSVQAAVPAPSTHPYGLLWLVLPLLLVALVFWPKRAAPTPVADVIEEPMPTPSQSASATPKKRKKNAKRKRAKH